MDLGSIIRVYRESHGLSQREFASLSGISNSYISMLEANRNTKNNLPISASIGTIKKVAEAMGVLYEEILQRIDESDENFNNLTAGPSRGVDSNNTIEADNDNVGIGEEFQDAGTDELASMLTVAWTKMLVTLSDEDWILFLDYINRIKQMREMMTGLHS